VLKLRKTFIKNNEYLRKHSGNQNLAKHLFLHGKNNFAEGSKILLDKI